MIAVYRLRFHGLDPAIAVGDSGEFEFLADPRVPRESDPLQCECLVPVFASLLTEAESTLVARCSIQSIFHPRLGAIRSIDTEGLTYEITLATGEILGVEAKEQPGTIEGSSLRVDDWSFLVEVQPEAGRPQNDSSDPERVDDVLTMVGGPVDESRATLAIYGDDLDPEAVSSQLGCSPSHAHRKGDRRTPTSIPSRSGAWLLTVEAKSPDGPEEAISSLLDRFPDTAEFWAPIRAQFRVSVRVGIHTSGWNRGFDLSPELTSKLGRLGLPVEFDLYLYGAEGDGRP